MVLYYILLPLAWIVFHVGFRVRAEGRDNLKKIRTRGYILAPNHISAIDPVFVILTRFWGRRMIVFAKKELFEINAFLSWFFRCAGAVRRANARRPVCHGEPPRYEEAPRQQAGASGRMGETVKERTWRFV